jgi:hypothetical protein
MVKENLIRMKERFILEILRMDSLMERGLGSGKMETYLKETISMDSNKGMDCLSVLSKVGSMKVIGIKAGWQG